MGSMIIYLAIILLAFSPLTKAGRPLSLIEDNILDSVTTTQEVPKNCEDQSGRRCVHFTQCDQDGFIGEDYGQLFEVRSGQENESDHHCEGLVETTFIVLKRWRFAVRKERRRRIWIISMRSWAWLSMTRRLQPASQVVLHISSPGSGNVTTSLPLWTSQETAWFTSPGTRLRWEGNISPLLQSLSFSPRLPARRSTRRRAWS